MGLAIGFGLGVYTLPILTAESGLDDKTIAELEQTAERRGVFSCDLEGSDALRWGDGIIMVNDKAVWLDGSVSPGPDYRLYLAPAFVETEADFIDIKAQSVEVGSIKAFTNFGWLYRRMSMLPIFRRLLSGVRHSRNLLRLPPCRHRHIAADLMFDIMIFGVGRDNVTG